MKLEMELGEKEVQELKFFADAVIWSGKTLAEDIQGRMMLCDIMPDPGDKCPELKRLTVLDECATATGGRLELCQTGEMRVSGKLEIPLEAEFKDAGGNTYFGKCVATYNVAIPAPELTRASCGEVILRCEAKELTVQATSPECVAYQLKLNIFAYLTRKTLVELEQEDEDDPAPNYAPGPVIVRESGMTRAPSAQTQPPANGGVPVMGEMARSMGMNAGGAGFTLDSLAAGATRNFGPRPAQSAPACPAKSNQTPCEASETDEDAFRTLVKMPIHHHNRH